MVIFAMKGKFGGAGSFIITYKLSRGQRNANYL